MERATTNFKRPGRSMCEHGHLHANPASAAACDAAWRYTERKRLQAKYGTVELIDNLLAILKRGKQ